MKDNSSSEIDRIDLNILRLLQDNGRLTNAELAQRVNVSAATCHRRTQRLFDEGYIKSVRALVDPKRLGLNTLVMVGIVLDRSTPESIAAFEAAVDVLDAILDCDLVAGDFDYLLRLRVKDMEDYHHFLAQNLIALPGVRQARTFFVVREVKTNAPMKF
ncbi:Lrp/AsnC family transcriptional regulator [Enterovibrio norvegicus]|uniref:Leucine-responsive regulatory protein n=1 Tax=Enterovibrio norvegicus TaxID=188144 RepID=A0A2N7LH35_9GAMM|nr:winged helix-turn-helix transcriptional regulator [Enterovibrio norvegicus]PML78528.1 AsnC family transcriptional regulator [Enterovibrio norvegicus]PMN94888.1 AsnC family transcriptional regulator [Enterovibrio norvegicus]